MEFASLGSVAAPKDRRMLRDRRRHQVAIAHVDRRIASRRETELQAFIWAHTRLRA